MTCAIRRKKASIMRMAQRMAETASPPPPTLLGRVGVPVSMEKEGKRGAEVPALLELVSSTRSAVSRPCKPACLVVEGHRTNRTKDTVASAVKELRTRHRTEFFLVRSVQVLLFLISYNFSQ